MPSFPLQMDKDFGGTLQTIEILAFQPMIVLRRSEKLLSTCNTHPKFNMALKSYKIPIGKDRRPTTIFQGWTVKLRGCSDLNNTTVLNWKTQMLDLLWRSSFFFLIGLIHGSEFVFFFGFCMIWNVWFTPLKMNGWKLKNHPIEKENHLNQTSILG